MSARRGLSYPSRGGGVRRHQSIRALVLGGPLLQYRDRGVQVTALCPGNTEFNFARVANAAAEKGTKAGDSPEMVADVGLDALLKGACTVTPGASNQQVAWLPRLLSRKRVVTIAGETWRKTLRARGVT